MAEHEVVAILGCGVLGTAIAKGLQGAGGETSYEVIATRKSSAGLEELERQGIRCGADNVRASKNASIVILGVRPQTMRELLREIAPSLRPGTICISIAAGLPLRFYEESLPTGVVVIRAHPSPMMTIRSGLIAMSPGVRASASDLERARRLLGLLCDETLLLPEQDINTFAALFGSSAALLYLFVEGVLSVEASRRAPELSRRSLAGMLAGAAQMLLQVDKSPRALSEEICTPNGMTIEGVKVWESNHMTERTSQAMEAVLARVEVMARSIK